MTHDSYTVASILLFFCGLWFVIHNRPALYSGSTTLLFTASHRDYQRPVIIPSVKTSRPIPSLPKRNNMDDRRSARLAQLATQNKMPRVGVIGAGISGLRSAQVLLQKGFHVTILEARDRIGG